MTLHRVHGGDPDKIAHSWYHGIGGTRRAIKQGKDISQHDYVTKFNNLLEHGDKRGDLDKALTAGYGGAGAPTAGVHGAVIQPESLERKTKKAEAGFKYVICDSCGHEQIYSKHQVKCRDCGKAWSLAKLLGVMDME
jgi:ribosomal protein S27E